MNWKPDFPALYGRDIVYCDNAATTHKPNAVIEAIRHFYATDYAPIYRGVYQSAEYATQQYEHARDQVASWIGADASHEIIFTQSATQGINLVAWSWMQYLLSESDEIVMSDLEHHAHIVTWQRCAQLTGCHLKRIPVTADGEITHDAVRQTITQSTKVVAISAHSNVTGLAIDTSYIVDVAHAHGAYVICDASQKAPRASLEVSRHRYDACVFSAHKMLGPTGLGVLYIPQRHHDAIAPYVYGGGMVHKVMHDEYVAREMPYRCEAGSPPSAQVIGFAAALSYLQGISFSQLHQHEAHLSRHVIESVHDIPGLHVVGPESRVADEGHMVTMYHDAIDAFDIAMYLDSWNICVRSGHHCAQPLHTALGIRNTVRISWYGYNTIEDAERVSLALKRMVT